MNASGISAGTAANAAVIREHSAAARVSVLVLESTKSRDLASPDGFRREISLDVAVALLVGRAVALRNLALGRGVASSPSRTPGAPFARNACAAWLTGSGKNCATVSTLSMI